MIIIRLSLRNLLTIVGVLVGLWLLVRIWDVLLLAAVGLMLAAALMPFTEWVRHRTHNRALSVLIVVAALFGAVALILLLIAPPMASQAHALWQQAPELRDEAARFADARGWTGPRDRIQAWEPAHLANAAGPHLLATSRTVLSGVFSLLTVIFLAAYFLLDARRLKQFVCFSTPRTWHRHIDALLPALQMVVGGYIRGQMITSASIFAFSLVMLTALHVPNAIALSAIAAIADLIPLVGVYILMAPMVLTALSVSVTTAIIAVALMTVYQQFEDRVLVPRVYGATLRLPTIAVVLAILVGAKLLGITGALLALPTAAGIRVVVEYFARVRTEPAEQAATAAAPPDQTFAPDEGPAIPSGNGVLHDHVS